jgi:hypothetical protein
MSLYTYTPTYYLAAAYNDGTYGSSNYNGSSTTSTGSSGGSTGTGGVLTNTGFDIAAILTLAALILFAAMVIRIWKRPRKHEAAK